MTCRAPPEQKTDGVAPEYNEQLSIMVASITHMHEHNSKREVEWEDLTSSAGASQEPVSGQQSPKSSDFVQHIQKLKHQRILISVHTEKKLSNTLSNQHCNAMHDSNIKQDEKADMKAAFCSA